MRPDHDLPIDIKRRWLQQRSVTCREFLDRQGVGPAPRRRQARRLGGPGSQSFACLEQALYQASSQNTATRRRDDDSYPRRRQSSRCHTGHEFEALAQRAKQVLHHLRIALDPLVQERCGSNQQRAMGPCSKANGTSRRLLKDGELAHRLALPYRSKPLFPSAGICQKRVEFAFDEDPELSDFVAG